jgi:hypothetical protein
MNDDRSLERAARSFIEAGPTQAPDRAVEAALLRIETTPQERDLRIPWRLPRMTTPARIVAAAVIGVLAVTGTIFLLGRTGDSGVGAPGPTPSPTATPLSIQGFRDAHDAICARAATVVRPLNDQLGGIYDATMAPADRSPIIDRLGQIGEETAAYTAELAAIQAPSDVAQEHAEDLARHRHVADIIAQEVVLLRAGKLAEAKTIDLSTDPISGEIHNFERKWALADCP